MTTTDINKLYASFDRLGFDLFLISEPEVPILPISLEDTVIKALLGAKPRLQEGIPIILIKNKVDYEKLKQSIKQNKLWNAFGYLGEFMLQYSNDSGLKELVDYCRDNKTPIVNMSGLSDAYFPNQRFVEEQKWNLIGAPSFHALEKQFKRYCRDVSKIKY